MLTSGVPQGISRVAFLSHCGASRCKGIHPACFVLDPLSLNVFLSMIYDLFHKARIYMNHDDGVLCANLPAGHADCCQAMHEVHGLLRQRGGLPAQLIGGQL